MNREVRDHDFASIIHGASRLLLQSFAHADALGPHVPTVLASFLADTSGGRGVRGEVLFPPGHWRVGARPSVLPEGDTEKQVERRIAALHHPTATLLEVGHHGSANVTTASSADGNSEAVIGLGYSRISHGH